MKNTIRSRKLTVNDISTQIGTILLDTMEFVDLVIKDGVFLEFKLENNGKANMIFSFYPDAGGVFELDGEFGTVGLSHYKCDSIKIKELIDWYNKKTNDGTTFKDKFWYPDT